jgi:tetrapyrrole methylase family protein / MazG family protein
MRSASTRFTELKKVFVRLHSPRGCQWDRKQTHSSILPHLQEEVDEFVAAVRKADGENMCEELGDILLHVMFHAQIASKEGTFDVEDVILGLVKKLKRRHPHVFAGQKVSSTSEIMRNWEKIKARERKHARSHDKAGQR